MLHSSDYSKQEIEGYALELNDISEMINSVLADAYKKNKRDDDYKTNISNDINRTEYEMNPTLRDMNIKLDVLLANSSNKVIYYLDDLSNKLNILLNSINEQKGGRKNPQERLANSAVKLTLPGTIPKKCGRKPVVPYQLPHT